MQGKKPKHSKRIIALVIIMLLIFAGFMLDLASIQLVHGARYASMVKRVYTYKSEIEASRGEILDRYGRPLVINRQAYSLIFDLSFFPPSSKQDQRNEIIHKLIRLMDKEEEEWIDILPLHFNDEGKIEFADKMESEINFLKSKNFLKLNHYATAQNCLDALIERFGLDGYSLQDARDIASVSFALYYKGFSMRNPYVFANDVEISTVSKVKENNDLFKGVDVEITSYREYADGTLAVHILGNLGAISEAEYEKHKKDLEKSLLDTKLSEAEKENLQANAYKMDSIIGKFGVEQAMEGYLRGKSGIKTIIEDINGEISQEFSLKPETGNTVILTLDADLQRVTEIALEKRILELTASRGLERAGACVVMDVNTGEVLASASYPSYDLNDFAKNYDKLASSDGKPLWNRAFQGAYAPGSTMKPAMALAGLESGVIDETTRLYCNGQFEYKGHTFDCLASHGSLNVIEALDYSCNIFFYRLADMMGINIMNEYSTMLGLGDKTGIEVAEAKGVLAGIPYVNSLGLEWLPGDTIQAAIGQSYNAFTPLQLANYCAALANGGKLMTPQIIKSVKSYDYSQTLLEKSPQVLKDTKFSADALRPVYQGMHRVATTGFCRSAFESCPVTAAAKTGTSQLRRIVNGVRIDENNGFLITYAPYENPEIAVAVVIEKVNSGTATANVAADIYNYYFNRTPEMLQAESVNNLLP